MKEKVQYSDDEIIQKVIEGEVQLFELLIRRYNPYLYKVARSQGYSHEDSQDLMQDTYVDAYVHLPGFEGRATFKTWLVKIMLNNCYRKRQKWNFKNVHTAEINERATPVFSNGLQQDVSKSIMNKELNSVIENALLKIPMDYQLVFTLREINGLSVKETADALEISEGNVKVRSNRAKAMLRKEVVKSYSTEEIFEFNLIYCDEMVRRVMNRIKSLKQ